MICKRCKKAKAIEGRQFCSTDCRNFYVSDLMIAKSQAIKKEFGNKYYEKKKNP